MYWFYLTSGEPDADRKGCKDCSHMKGAVTLWCENKEAIAKRGTSLPGTRNCPYWSPIPTKRQLDEEFAALPLHERLTSAPAYHDRYAVGVVNEDARK